MDLEQRLRAAGDWLGASCVARWRDAGFLFAARTDDDRLVLSGIGGKVEPGETFADAMRREYREETGAEPGRILAPPPRHLGDEARRHPVPGGAAALLAERPAAHPTGGTLWIAVYLAVAARAPRPVEKVRVFAVLPPTVDGRAGVAPRDVALLVDDQLVPATRTGVTTIDAEHTARAVLTEPGLLRRWWAVAT